MTTEVGQAPPRPSAVATSRAVNRLLMAGMVLRHISASGSSYYLGWRGRSGVLRISDHQSRVEQDGQDHIHARITLHEESLPKTEDGFENLLARALGQFLMRTGEATVDRRDGGVSG